MSKRFGRNQRRRMREQVETLQYAKQLDRALIGDQGRRLARLESEMQQWDDEIISLLGRYSSFQRKTPEMRVRDIRDFRQVADDVNDMRAAMRMVDLSGPVSDYVVRSVRMQKMVALISRDAVMLRSLVRLRLIDDERTTAMAISEDQIRCGLTPRDIEYLAMEIARNLAHTFNHAYVPYPKPKKVADA